MKKIIYTEINCELDNYKSKKGIGLVHENIWSSFIKDTYSFFILVSSFWINANFIGSRALSVCLMIVWLLWTLKPMPREELTLDEFIEKAKKMCNNN